MQALGAKDKDFAEGLMGQLLSANVEDGQLDDRNFRMMLSFVEGVEPKNSSALGVGPADGGSA